MTESAADARSAAGETIKQILISDVEVDPAKVAETGLDTPLLGRGIGIDSMETLGLVAGIEREFDIEVPDEDLTADLFKTIGTLADYVVQRTSQA